MKFQVLSTLMSYLLTWSLVSSHFHSPLLVDLVHLPELFASRQATGAAPPRLPKGTVAIGGNPALIHIEAPCAPLIALARSMPCLATDI